VKRHGGKEDSEGTIKSEDGEEGGKKLSSYLLDRPRSSMVANEEGNFPDDVGKVHG